MAATTAPANVSWLRTAHTAWARQLQTVPLGRSPSAGSHVWVEHRRGTEPGRRAARSAVVERGERIVTVHAARTIRWYRAVPQPAAGSPWVTADVAWAAAIVSSTDDEAKWTAVGVARISEPLPALPSGLRRKCSTAASSHGRPEPSTERVWMPTSAAAAAHT